MNDWSLILRELGPTIPYITASMGLLWCLYTNMGNMFPWRGREGVEKVEIPLLSWLLEKVGIELFINVDWFRLNLVINFPVTILWFVATTIIAVFIFKFPLHPVDRDLALIVGPLSLFWSMLLTAFWRKDLQAAKKAEVTT